MPEFEVLSRTQKISVHHTAQRIVVDPTQKVHVMGGRSVINVINAGVVGPPGPTGPSGPQGPTGPGGRNRFYGDGPPGTVIGAQPHDEYVDRQNGDLYELL